MTFSFVQTQNCRKFIKRCYTMPVLIDSSLILLLEEEFGMAEIYEFSKFNPQSKDTFKISVDIALQISGNLADTAIFFTVSKEKLVYLEIFENYLNKWLATYFLSHTTQEIKM